MKKEKKRRHSHGTISVFLVLILVPCIIVACVFGDASRVELSKAQAASASDLALYSLLSHYDEDLKEYYGLVASCQDIEQFYDVTATYFTGMMSAEGVSGEGSELFLAYLQSLRSGDISDFLQVEFASPASVAELSNSGMGNNAALIEDSIVEFMKYRGPYEIVTNMMERFKLLDVSGSVSDAEKNEPIVEAKQDYAEAEGKLLKAAFYSYLAIQEYVKKYESTGLPSLEKYEQYEEHLRKIGNDFARVTELITMYYAGTDGISNVNFPMYTLQTYQYRPANIGTKVKTDSETLYCIDNALLTELLKNIDVYIQDVERAQNNIVNACAGLPDPTPVSSDVNPAIYCMKVQNAVSRGDLNTLDGRGRTLMDRYARLKAARECDPYPEESDLPENWKAQLDDAMSRIESVQKQYYTRDGRSSYSQLVNRYKTVAADRGTIRAVQERQYEFTSEYLGRNVTIGAFIGEVKNEFSQLDTALTEQIKRLDVAIDGGWIKYNGKNYKVNSLDQLKNLLINYVNKREDWGNKAKNGGTAYAESELQEYNGQESEEDALAAELAEIGEEAMDNLKTRLSNIRKDMKDYQNALKEFTYGGKKVTNFGGREEVISAGRSVIPSSVSISLNENKSAAVGYHSSLLRPSASEIYKAPALITGETGNHPDLRTDPPVLYALYRKKFLDKEQDIEKKVSEAEEQNDKYEKDAEKQKKSAEEIDNKYLSGKGGNISSSHGGKTVSALSAVGSMITIVDNFMNGNGDELRDQIYVCEYVMDMFSYSSFNNEGQHRLAVGDGKTYTLDDFSQGGYPGYTDLWNTESKTQTPENQSLTNQPINAKHNQANLGEIEYILYGNKNIDENLKTSYRNLFAIRESLNLVSGFQHFYRGTNGTAQAINTIANAIALATSGVVPAPVTKCVLIGVLATMETAHDMDRLKAGVPVALYKGADNWYYSIGGSSSASFDKSKEPVDANGLYYGDYMYIFLMVGLTNSSTYQPMLLRIGDLIQANMRLTEGNGSFDLNKSRTYFEIDAQLRVKPLMLNLPIANSMQNVDTKSLLDETGWCTYKVSVVRGYS